MKYPGQNEIAVGREPASTSDHAARASAKVRTTRLVSGPNRSRNDLDPGRRETYL